MANTVESASIQLLINTMKEYVRLNHSLISEIQADEQLSMEGSSKLNQAKITLTHLSRSLNMLDCLTGSQRTVDSLTPQSFVAIQIVEQICNAVESILSTILPFSINFSCDLTDDSSIITVDKTRIEAIIFHLLYYCLAGCEQSSANKVDLNLHVQENNDSFTFRISSKSPEIQNPFDKYVLNMQVDDDTHFTAGRGSISLLIARKLSESADYTMHYFRSKKTNVYNITVPQPYSNKITTIIPFYTANTILLRETFSDILFYSEVKSNENSGLCSESTEHSKRSRP